VLLEAFSFTNYIRRRRILNLLEELDLPLRVLFHDELAWANFDLSDASSAVVGESK
jgi:hypothetical protein